MERFFCGAVAKTQCRSPPHDTLVAFSNAVLHLTYPVTLSIARVGRY